jgi:hypothetical protein
MEIAGGHTGGAGEHDSWTVRPRRSTALAVETATLRRLGRAATGATAGGKRGEALNHQLKLPASDTTTAATIAMP